jgi:hypothetical protein
MKLHLETVLPDTMRLLKQLMEIKELNQFRLVGGTALALQFGHRSSVDLDLFAGGRADTLNLPNIINQYFKNAQLVSKNQNGIMLTIDNIKVDIVDWKVPFTQEPLVVNGLRICSPLDIFASKCEAILDRKAEKDFVDIAVISKYFDLGQLFQILKIRYPFITTGSITAFLLRRDLIVRDHSIQYFNDNNFDQSADLIQQKITDFEKKLKDKKQLEAGERARKIQELINKKRNKTP